MQKISHQPTKIKQKQKKNRHQTNLKNPNQQYKPTNPAWKPKTKQTKQKTLTNQPNKRKTKQTNNKMKCVQVSANVHDSQI